MIGLLAKKIASFFCIHSLLSDKRFEWYSYTIEKKLVGYAGILFLVLLGTIVSNFTTTIVFIAGFYILRSRAGGYHAPTFWICLILSTCTILINIYVVQPIMLNHLPILPILIGAISGLVLFFLGTVAHASVQHTAAQMKRQCYLMRIITILQFCLILIFGGFEFTFVYASNLASGMGFVAVSSVIGKIKISKRGAFL